MHINVHGSSAKVTELRDGSLPLHATEIAISMITYSAQLEMSVRQWCPEH